MHKTTKHVTFACVLLLSASSLFAQIPEKAQFGNFAITNVEIHTITNGVISNGTILIEADRLTHVGERVDFDSNIFTEIDGTGLQAYPGFIDSGTTLGLSEISQIPVTRDEAEVGDYNPQVNAFSAFHPASVLIPVTRVNGVTTVISHPVSGVISGKATLMNLYGYTADSMAVVARAALHVQWPTATRRGGWDSRSEKEMADEYQKNLDKLDDFFETARFYHHMWTEFETNPRGKNRPDRDFVMQSMREVLTGEVPVMITADHEQDLRNALEWISKNSDLRFLLSSVAEGWRVADEIAAAGVPVLVGPALRTPSRAYDNFMRPYQNAGKLHNAGVVVAIRTGENENVRNLPYNAGYFATYGLGREEALRAITITPAILFGVGDQLGSLEVGKKANLFLADGDPLETMTNITQVFIDGYKIPMTNKQIKLYQEYRQRDVR